MASFSNVQKRSKSTGNIIVIKRPFTFVYGHKQAITQNFIPNAKVYANNSLYRAVALQRKCRLFMTASALKGYSSQGSLVSDIPAGDGKLVNLFYSEYTHLAGPFLVLWQSLRPVGPNQEKLHTAPYHSLICISTYHWLIYM
jgi:hypothetical protein